MKKITQIIFTFLMVNISLKAQTFSSGVINLSSTPGLEYTAQFDITSSEVTLTLIGPSDRWLGIGMGVQSMTNNGDLVIYTGGSTLSDRTFGGIGVTPAIDAIQDWSIATNTISSGVRTLVATRALSTSETNDYEFTASTDPINLVWARGNSSSFNVSNHGGNNRGITSSQITLGVNDLELASNFKIIPNPASSMINIKLSNSSETGMVKVYNALGKQIHNKSISNFDSSIDVNNWSNGIYLVLVEVGKKSQTKRFIKL